MVCKQKRVTGLISLMLRFFYILAILLQCVTCQDVTASVDEVSGEEKAWMPWPSSVPDPNKIYTTTILDPAYVTDIQSTTETISITRTIISYTTDTVWSTTLRYATQSTTSFYDTVSSTTITLATTVTTIVTETIDTTVTTSSINTVFLGDVGEAQKSVLINRFIASGFSSGNIQFSTITITEKPRTTITEFKTAKILRKTTETSFNVITSVGSRTVWDTVWGTETKTDTLWTTVKSTSTVTLSRVRR